MDDPIPPYHTRLEELTAELAARSSFGILLFDLSFIGEIELEYGTTAYAEVRGRIRTLIREQRGKDFRKDDVLCLDEPKGAALLLFLDRKRRKDLPVLNADLLAARQRLGKSFARSLGRAAFPYRKTPPRIPIGQGVALHNPLVTPKRVIQSALDSARRIAQHERTSSLLEARQRLEDLIAGQRIVTAYQPIMRIAERETIAVEALSRGARGTGLEAADLLFSAATRHGMLIELDRLCRSRALLSSTHVPSKAMLFVNTLPATIRDPQFRGKPLIDFLDKAHLAPDRIVIEITEKLVIENYGLFLESMAYFSELRMRFAVDDVGSGYSGLEAISRLKPAFLKIDMSLVRHVHESAVNREMVKAIIALGHGIGAEVIAEGIETQEEADALVQLGTDYGQGYLLARPQVATEAAS
jgi:EAL domain-containing protein (putative c-di-GMP-specific phosphodiesterase class I)